MLERVSAAATIGSNAALAHAMAIVDDARKEGSLVRHDGPEDRR